MDTNNDGAAGGRSKDYKAEAEWEMRTKEPLEASGSYGPTYDAVYHATVRCADERREW